VSAGPSDLVCFCHLRWDFVYQRPQHLVTRHARVRRTFFVEEPRRIASGAPRLDVATDPSGVRLAVPHLPESLGDDAANAALRELLDDWLRAEEVRDPILWYYTPMALPYTQHLRGSVVVYDCMDHLAGFRGAPPALAEWERRLYERADVVFTGGWSLYEANRSRHANIHGMPSSVDVAHFHRAREPLADPADQAPIPRPRLGFFGVIDERMDLGLVAAVADLRPDWHVVLIGPVVKIDPADVPRRANVHVLGAKPYRELAGYLSGWDVAILPFARNEATRFISPTKTPEYLAAGRAVVSTSIEDVVRPYGEEGLVEIADTPGEFVAAAERAMASASDPRRLRRVDERLAGMSWDRTWARMEQIVAQARSTRGRATVRAR
jgi:UDP-galactopyranose mutase